MKSSEKRIAELLAPTVEAMGLELWGVEHITQGRHSLLRITIDAESGVGIEDCERVSRQLSGILDVEDPVSGEYTLEVSSPGLDRRLFNESQYARYLGHVVAVRMKVAIGGRRNFSGTLQHVDAERIVINQEGQTVELAFRDIEKGQLAP